MQLTHLACKTTIVFARGFCVHVCMCLSIKQLKSLNGKLAWWKRWLCMPRRSQHPFVVLVIQVLPQGSTRLYPVTKT